MNLLKRSVRGADRVGQPPHGVGDDQDDPRRGQWRTEAGKIPSVENPQVTDSQHHPGIASGRVAMASSKFLPANRLRNSKKAMAAPRIISRPAANNVYIKVFLMK